MIEALKHLTGRDIERLHGQGLSFGGLSDYRHNMTVASITGRIDATLFYHEFDSVEDVAALYAETIAQGHVFNDGNKRTAFLAMMTFLKLNGVALNADSIAIADLVISLAAGEITRKDLTTWLSKNCTH